MTERVPFGTGITPPGARFHPAMIAQAWMTLERMFPGRPFLCADPMGAIEVYGEKVLPALRGSSVRS